MRKILINSVFFCCLKSLDCLKQKEIRRMNQMVYEIFYFQLFMFTLFLYIEMR